MQKFFIVLSLIFLFFVDCQNAKKASSNLSQDTETKEKFIIGVISDDEAKLGSGCLISYYEKGKEKQGNIFVSGSDSDFNTGWIAYIKIDGKLEKLHEISELPESSVFENENFKVRENTRTISNSEESDTWNSVGTLTIINKKTGEAITLKIEGGGAC